MSDLHTVANAADLRLALQAGVLRRATVESLDLPPLHVAAVRLDHLKLLGPRLTGLAIDALEALHVQARGAVLRAVRWPDARLAHWHVSASQAQEMQLPGARLEQCQFVDTPLTNSNLRRAQLLGCTFQQADLNHVVLAAALLLRCHFEDARQGGAVLDNADLRDAVLCHVDLRGANLLRANFSGAILVDVDLRDANLKEAQFAEALVVNSRLDRTEFAHLMASPASHEEVWQRLERLPGEQVRAIAAGLLMAPAQREGAAPEAPAGSQGADSLAALLQLSFPALLRELQGRGGPPELARLRVDGDQVWATTHSGDEVRLTSGPAQLRMAPQMAVPLPGTAAPQPKAPPPAPAASPAKAGPAGLEID